MERELRRSLGAGIRSLRQTAGLTIAQLAELAGVDSGFLAYIELGRKLPSLPTLAKIAAGLDVPMGRLIDERAPVRPEPDHAFIQQVRSLLHGLGADDRRALLSILRRLRRGGKIGALLEILGR